MSANQEQENLTSATAVNKQNTGESSNQNADNSTPPVNSQPVDDETPAIVDKPNDDDKLSASETTIAGAEPAALVRAESLNAPKKLRSYQMHGNGYELFEYNNVWLTDMHVKAARDLQWFALDRTVNTHIIINSYPRSGTTWLKAAVAAMFSSDPQIVLKQNVHKIIPSIEDCEAGVAEAKPWRMSQTSSTTIADICHTHLPMSLWTPQFFAANVAVIYIYRNLKDTAVSNYHFMRSVQVGKSGIYTATINDMIDEIIAGQCWCGPYAHHVADAIKYGRDRLGKRFLLLNYDVIMQDQLKALVDIRRFLLDTMGVAENSVDLSTSKHHRISLPHHSHFALHLHSSPEKQQQHGTSSGGGDSIKEAPGMPPLNSIEQVLSVVTFDAMKKSGINQMDNVPEAWDSSKGKFIRRAIVGGWRDDLSEENGMKLDAYTQNAAAYLHLPDDVAKNL